MNVKCVNCMFAANVSINNFVIQRVENIMFILLMKECKLHICKKHLDFMTANLLFMYICDTHLTSAGMISCPGGRGYSLRTPSQSDFIQG